MSHQQPGHSSEETKSETKSQPKLEPEPKVLRTSHSYDDGNITFCVRGTLFKLHKSILAIHSDAFKDMFGLPDPQLAESEDVAIPLDDDPKSFDIVLTAIYDGVEFVRNASIIQLMDAITITHKYQMTRLEDNLQHHIIKTTLPSSAADGVRGSGFHHYDQNPGLAMAVLRLGADELVPWAFYSVGVHFFSEINIGNTPTYAPPPAWFAFDPEFAYSFFVLRQIVNDVFENWDQRISAFYTGACSRSVNTRSTTANKCARSSGRYGPNSPFYISSNQKRVDPVREMAPKIKEFATVLTGQKDIHHSTWCYKCNTEIQEVASSILGDMYPHLVDCVTRMNRVKPRCS